MSKQPYIPIYIGDWEQDVNTISLEAEGALLKLTFKLWKSSEKGLLTISLQQLAILCKKSEEITLKIVQELHENRVLNITFLEQNVFKFESRRYTKEAHISKVRSQAGLEGVKQKVSKNLAKHKQNTEYEYENDNENNKEKKRAEILNSRGWIEQVAMNKKVSLAFVNEKLSEFLADLDDKEDFEKNEKEIKRHFVNWLKIEIQKTQTANAKQTTGKPNQNIRQASRHALVDVARETIKGYAGSDNAAGGSG